MERSNFSEADICSPGQNYPAFHYHVKKSPSMGLILCQMNPAHAIISYFFHIRYNIILPPTPWSPMFSSLKVFPNNIFAYIYHF